MDNVLKPRYKYITLFVVLVVIVLVLLFGALPDNNLFWRELQNSGHTLLFIPIAVLILLLLRERSNYFRFNSLKLYMVACFVSLLIGVIIELMQLLMSRDASLIDVVRDLAGIIVGLGLCAITDTELQAYRLKSGKKMTAGIVMLIFCIFMASMYPLVFLSTAYVQRGNAFPVVVDLSSNWARPFLRLMNAVITLPENDEVRVDGEDQLTHVEFKRGIYPGISIIEVSPDWSAYKTLAITVYSKRIQPFELVLRIHDDQHNYVYSDRFNTKLTVNQGVNYFHVLLEDIKKSPVSREMNMMRLRELVLFSAQPAEELDFYLGDMRLE